MSISGVSVSIYSVRKRIKVSKAMLAGIYAAFKEISSSR